MCQSQSTAGCPAATTDQSILLSDSEKLSILWADYINRQHEAEEHQSNWEAARRASDYADQEMDKLYRGRAAKRPTAALLKFTRKIRLLFLAQ